MASICNDPNGKRRILFVASDGTRKTIRLGKVSLRHAESVKVKVQDLVASTITGSACADETSHWLTALDDGLYGKLSTVGLTRPRGSAMLGSFTRTYIDGRVDIKESTRINLERARTYLLEFFDEDKPLRDFTAGDAEDFRLYLVGKGKAENTWRRAIGRARQFFGAAKKHGLVQSDPFEDISTAVRANHERFHFISREVAAKVSDACPDAQWRLIFALARFGGLRCPSEVLKLTWGDINWERNLIRVPSPKTEHHEGGASRMIPLFPELKQPLLDAFDEAEEGTEWVITRYRGSNMNLRTQLFRIIARAGVEPWPKLFQNLRSTRETELVEQFPAHVACRWIGNTQPIAAKHYLQLTDEHFAKAVAGEPEKVAHNAAQKAHATARMERSEHKPDDAKTPSKVGVCEGLHEGSNACKNLDMPGIGLEPMTR